MKLSQLNKHHIHQQDQSDCGVACLHSSISFFGGQASLERLRELSGTNQQGTTLLGLKQAAEEVGLEAEGYEADTSSLRECESPCILHIVKEETLQHYVLCYGYDVKNDIFLIGDPAELKVQRWSGEKLLSVWESTKLLLLKKTSNFDSSQNSFSKYNKWLLENLREDFDILIVSFIIGIAVTILGLSTALYSQKLIDDILPNLDTEKLFITSGLLLFLLIAKSFFNYLRQILLIKQSKNFNIRIIDCFFNVLLHLPKQFFDNRKTGDMITRMNDSQRIQRTIARIVGSTIIDVLVIVAIIIVVFSYYWKLGLMLLIWLPIFAVIVFFYHSKIVDGQRNVMTAYAMNESNYVDIIQGIGTIKVTNKQGLFSALTKNIYTYFQEAILRLGKVSVEFSLSVEVAGAVLLISIIVWGSLSVIDGIMTIGGMMAVLQLTGMLASSTVQLAVTNIQLQEAKVAFERMYEFTNIQTETARESKSSGEQISEFNQLAIHDLSFRYPGRKPLLHDISINLQKGEWITVLGESGSGKSTLFQILQKFYKQETGAISVNGIDYDQISYENWRSLIGVVPQDIKIFNASLIDNIVLGDTNIDTEKIMLFFTEYGFDTYFKNFPNGYATLLGEDGINISGGERQLVAFARALYSKPQLLLLDEPTSGLDRDAEQFIIKLLHKLKKNVGIILLTHRLSIAKQADRILIIENGTIEHEGQHEELLKSKNLYAKLWSDVVAM